MRITLKKLYFKFEVIILQLFLILDTTCNTLTIIYYYLIENWE